MKKFGLFVALLALAVGLSQDASPGSASPAYIYSADGVPIKSTNVGGIDYLNVVNSEVATAAPNTGTLPALLKIIGGYDGTNTRVLRMDTSGNIGVIGMPSSIGQKTMALSLPVVIASDQSAVPASQSGIWDLRNITGTVTLPTGASTSANQSTEITSLGSIDGKLGSLGQKAMLGSAPVVIASDQSAIPASESGVWNITNVSGTVSLPTGASTSALQTTGNTSLSSIDGKLGSLGQKAMVGSAPVVIASDQSAIPASESGVWNITNVSGTVSLPTGASTAANQSTGNTSLASIDGKLGSLGQKAMIGSAPVVLASDQAAIPVTQSGTWSTRLNDGAGTSVTVGQKVMASSLPVTISSDQSAVQIKGALSTSGSGSAAAATVTAGATITLTKPANATGFILQNMDTSTANLRWALGRTSSATLGQQLQPGRDTGFIPASVDISLSSESGTQTYDVQWVSQ